MDTTHEVKIRQVRRSDLSYIVGIEDASFTDPYPERLLTTLATFYPKTFVVATLDNEVIGYASAIMEEKQFSHLLSIAVSPKCRRNGIGKKLLKALIESVRKQRSHGIKLEVNGSNQAAVNLYRGFGFLEQKKVLSYYPDGNAAIIMVLKW